MSRFSDQQRTARVGWPHLLLGLAVLAAIATLLITDAPLVRTVALTLLASVPIAQLSVILVRALRSGRLSATDRARHPAAYWSAMLGLLLFILLLAATLFLALQD